MNQPKSDYRHLDAETNRRALVEEIRKIRQEAPRLVALVPQNQWYTPRYHGWSLAAMLGHLHMMDNLTLRMMQFALRGVSLPISKSMLNLFNDTMSRFFRQRDVETTLRELQKNEPHLIAFVLRLPPDKSHRKLYDPWLESYLTVEEAVQEFFLIHWQGHLQTVRQVDDRPYHEPSAAQNEVV